MNKMKSKHINLILSLLAVLLAAALAATFCLLLCWKSFKTSSRYVETDCGKEALFGGQRVMLIVPHQDDDLSILGGVIEEYIKYGSDVRVLFTTTGDFSAADGVRMQEAIEVLSLCGVPEENIVFLGYIDSGLFSSVPSIYNAEADELITYPSGHTSTYGLPGHSAYNEGRLYTRSNLLEDLENAILDYMPDILFCNDYDAHPDHRAASLFFDEAMCNILKSNPDYNPLILKSFAYSYTFYGYQDFYDSPNIISTRKTCEEPFLAETNTYLWENRIRLPVSAAVLSRCLDTSKLYEEESLYVSQNAQTFADRVINGDRVFFQRRSDSLCLNAEISSDSGNTKLLNDFKLYDSCNISVEDTLPTDGVWHPDTAKGSVSFTVTFPEPVNIKTLSLYDSPSLSDNILDALITFDSGFELHTGPLAANGSESIFEIDCCGISSFTVKFLSWEGDSPGISEIEAFESEYTTECKYIKLMNFSGDFVYDYWIDGSEDFSLYSSGCSFTLEDCLISCSNEKCSAELINGALRVKCPYGQSALITLSCDGGQISDTVLIKNPSVIERIGWAVEKWGYENNYPWRNNFLYRLLR